MVPPQLHGRVCVGLPESHGRIRIGLPDLHRRFRNDPPKWFIHFRISHGRFPTQSGLSNFPKLGNSLVPWLLCQKSNKKTCFIIKCIFSVGGPNRNLVIQLFFNTIILTKKEKIYFMFERQCNIREDKANLIISLSPCIAAIVRRK